MTDTTENSIADKIKLVIAVALVVAGIAGYYLLGASSILLRILSVVAGIVAGLANGTLRPVIGKEMPLSDAPKAHQAVMEAGAFGKIVLIP